MSRILMVLVLAILLGLLAVMAHIVNPKPAPPPSAEQQQAQEKQQQEMSKKMMEAERKERTQMMKMREQKTKEWAAKQQKLEKQYAAKQVKPKNAVETAPPQSSTAMDISHDWFKKRQDGEEGLKKLEQLQKELEAAERARVLEAKPVSAPKPQ